jgi:hypothetical protein
MTHERRLAAARLIRDEHPELNARIVADTGPLGELGSTRSARMAWAAVDPDATHHLVLQDDVWLPDDFIDRVTAVVAQRPNDVLSLFGEWGAQTSSTTRLAALIGAGWAEVIDIYVPTQAAVMPAALAQQADRYFEHAIELGQPDDIALRGYVRSNGLVPYLCVPNMVEHRDGPSLTGNFDKHGLRLSTCLLADEPPIEQMLKRPAVSGIDLVPFMAWWQRATTFCVRTSAGPREWVRVPAMDLLPAIGLTEAMLRDACRAACADTDGVADVVNVAGKEPVFEYWLAAFGLGLWAAAIAEEVHPNGPAEVSTTTPAARRALESFGPGVMRACVPPDRMASVGGALTSLAEAGVRNGVDTFSSGAVTVPLRHGRLTRHLV